MTGFSGSPQNMKGAIVSIDILNPLLTSVVVFQYNPESMTRSLQAQTAGEEGANPSEAMRLKGAPIETIKINVDIDATDQLEKADGIATTVGIHPQLAALETILYPKSPLVIANTALMAAGTMEILPPVAPFTLFIWGPMRVLPVRLSDLSITEEAHDISLNPIRAKVDLSLRVLSYSDLPIDHPGYYMYLSHQIIKEAMAVVGGVGNISGSFSASASVNVSI